MSKQNERNFARIKNWKFVSEQHTTKRLPVFRESACLPPAVRTSRMRRVARVMVIHERIASVDECEDEAGVKGGVELSGGGGCIESDN